MNIYNIIMYIYTYNNIYIKIDYRSRGVPCFVTVICHLSYIAQIHMSNAFFLSNMLGFPKCMQRCGL